MHALLTIQRRSRASLVRSPEVESVIKPKLVAALITVNKAPSSFRGVACLAVTLDGLVNVLVECWAATTRTVSSSDGGRGSYRNLFTWEG